MNLNKGLIGHWTMDSADTDNGMLRDRSAYGRDMNIVNSPDIGEDSPIGESYLFDANDYTEVEYTPENIESSYTLAFWCYFPSDNNSSSYPVPFTNTSSDDSSTDYNGFKWSSSIRFVPSGSNEFNHISKSIDIEDEWFHLVGVYDDGDAYLYENARLEASDTGFNTPEPLSYINIGAEPRDGTYFNGRISDARFYNRALSEQEINALYNMRSQRLQSNSLDRGLVGYWSMDSIDNDMVRDSSANDNHGEVKEQSVSTIEGKVGQAVDFPDEDSCIDTGIDFAIHEGDGHTLTAWVYCPDYDGSQRMIVSQDYYRFGFRNTSDGEEITFYTREGSDGNISVNADIVTSQWVFVVGTSFIDGDEIHTELYIDGVKEATTTDSGSSYYDLTGELLIGARDSGGGGPQYGDYNFTGSVDEVRTYNRALGEDEITRLYNQRQ